MAFLVRRGAVVARVRGRVRRRRLVRVTVLAAFSVPATLVCAQPAPAAPVPYVFSTEGTPPVAVTGGNQTVAEGALVTLDGSRSVPGTAAVGVSSWEAGAGVLPPAACPAWTDYSNVNGTFRDGALHIGTGSNGDSTMFGQSGNQLVVPEVLVVEAWMRLGEGSEPPWVSWRLQTLETRMELCRNNE